MLNLRLKLNQDVFLGEEKKSPRDGFGDAILELADKNKSISCFTRSSSLRSIARSISDLAYLVATLISDISFNFSFRF